MLETKGESLEGKRAVISGSGNVATHAAEKVCQLGGTVLTLSDSKGFLHDPAGMDQTKIDWIKRQKGEIRGNLADYVEFSGSSWHEGEKPWGIACDVALPVQPKMRWMRLGRRHCLLADVWQSVREPICQLI